MRRRSVRYLLLLATLIASVPPPATHAQEVTADAPRFKETVDLVVLTVTVQQGDGAYIDALERGDFQIFEEGVPQSIAFFGADVVPLDLILMLDTSGSMSPALPIARRAATALARGLRPTDRAAVYTFNQRAQLRQPFTNDVSLVERALDNTSSAGNTALFDSVTAALTDFPAAERADTPRRRALILLSDGEDTASLSGYEDVVERAQRLGVTMYTVALQQPRATNQRQVIRQQSETAYQMRALATHTGGRTFPLTTVDELAGAYESIATELGHQYCVAYMPAAARPRGQLTRVAVLVDRPNVKVRTRTGYVGSGPPAARASQ
jgi:Ca-activated chloride channel homolog